MMNSNNSNSGRRNVQQLRMVAFNSTNPRFGRFAGHPELGQSRPYDKPKGCDPAKYSPKYDYRKCNTYVPGCEPWTYQRDLQEWSKHLGYRNFKLLRRRLRQNSNLGPAWHDVKFYPEYEPACKNVSFGRSRRFTKPSNNDSNPGPGTYHRKNPYKVPYGPHSTRPTFEREHPCRFREIVPPWYRGVSGYKIIDKDDIAMKPKKLVSLRGPYDLFTGKRDASTIISKYNYGKKQSAISWPYTLKLDTINKPNVGISAMKTGRERYFGRNAAIDLLMCRRLPNEPNATHYQPYPGKAIVQNKAPFNSNEERSLNFERYKVGLPSVSQYNIAVKGSCATPGHQHLFRSKTKRDIMEFFVPKPMNTF